MQLGNKNEKEIAHYSDYNLHIGDLCSELSYFVIFDFPYTQKSPENMKKTPTIVTYRHDDITFKEILKRYLKLSPKKKEGIRFTLSRGFIISMKSTVLDLKKSLRRDNLDGVVLFTYEAIEDEQQEDENADSGFVDQCGLMDYIGVEEQFAKDQQSTFHFFLPKTKYVVSVQILPSERVSTLIEQFFKEVSNQFGIALDKEDIKQFKIRGKKDGILKPLEIISNHKELHNNDEIQVVLQNKNIEFIRKFMTNNVITLIKEEVTNNNTKETRSIKLNYEEIKNMQVSKINEQFFLTKGENKFNPICLKVMEIILKGDEKMTKISYAIQKLKELGDVKLVGFFINEKIVFYKEIPLLMKTSKEFTLEQLDIPTTEFVERNKCDKMINERLDIIEQAYFKNKEHVQPIFVYTSNLKYKDKETGVITKIYDSLNRCLREQSVLKKKPEQIAQQWVYRYTSTLLKHLQEIRGERCKVYRGVNYDPEGREGEMMTFKPFTSTTKNQQVAINFALQDIIEKPNLPLTLFEMNILGGKPINKLSYFSNEEELLLQPFSEFRIVKIQRNVTKLGYSFTVYKLEEVNSSKEMPKTINNYILWVDHNPTEGKEIFNRYIEQFYYPTVLFQIKSTEELAEWIAERQNIINDDSSKIIMITNMVRPEKNGTRNFYAGVQAINLVRKTLPKIPIAVYVRDINAANNNLNQKNVERQNLVVISQFEDLATFASQHTNLKFRSILPPPDQSLSQTQPNPAKANSSGSSVDKQSKSTLTTKASEKGICNIM